jgi:hypothetical protein
MNLLQKNKILIMRGKWYRKKITNFCWEYIYIKGISDFGYEAIVGHSIEVNTFIGDNHKFSTIHVNTAFNNDHLKKLELIKDKDLIKNIDKMLSILFYDCTNFLVSLEYDKHNK